MAKRITSALLMVLLVAGTAGARKFYDDDPLGPVLRAGAWLAGLTVAFAVLARLTVRRLLV